MGPPRKGKSGGLSLVRMAVIVLTLGWGALLLFVVHGHRGEQGSSGAAAAAEAAAPMTAAPGGLVHVAPRRFSEEETFVTAAEEAWHLKPAEEPPEVLATATAAEAPAPRAVGEAPVVRFVAAEETPALEAHRVGDFVMERDEQTGLMVPEWWEPAAGLDELDVTAKNADGDPTIFLMIASYRDFQCRDTAISALQRADKPKRVVVAVVEQNTEDDVPCTEPEFPCAERPDQVLCVYRDSIHVYKMDAQEATGPVYARHVGYRMYRGEAFAMQIDAHCAFANHWDSDIIKQWTEAHNEMAVLSTYLTDLEGSLSPTGDSLRNTRPIMCNSDYEGSGKARYLRHGSQPEGVPTIRTSPMLQPYWAAGFSFSRGHFLHRVRYDCCLPMVFMGEEISLGIRGWSHGYDMYAPTTSVVFHEYAQSSGRRRSVPKFWEAKGGKSQGEGQRSLKRLTSLIGMSTDIDPSEWNHFHESEYGLGTERDVKQFYDLILTDVVKREAQPLCRFVEPGHMHREIHDKHLRPNGRGIDYSKVDVDVQAFINAKLYDPVARALRHAIDSGDDAAVRRTLIEARRHHLAARPEYAAVLKEAQEVSKKKTQHG